MSKQKCSAKDPANCRYHGTSTSKIEAAVASGDINAYMEARENQSQNDIFNNYSEDKFINKMFTEAINENNVSMAVADDALSEIRFYDQYMIDAGLYTDDDELADERESNEIEIHQNLQILISEYNNMTPESKTIVRNKLTPRDKEVIKDFYGELDLPVPKDFQ